MNLFSEESQNFGQDPGTEMRLFCYISKDNFFKRQNCWAKKKWQNPVSNITYGGFRVRNLEKKHVS
jgi:hypothetical protein